MDLDNAKVSVACSPPLCFAKLKLYTFGLNCMVLIPTACKGESLNLKRPDKNIHKHQKSYSL